MDSFGEGSQREHGKEGQGDQDHRDAGDHADELRPVGRNVPTDSGVLPCLASEPASASTKRSQEPADTAWPDRGRCCTTRC